MGKKDKSTETKELSKSEKKAIKAAKKAAKKELKEKENSPVPAIHAGLLVGITPAQAKSTLEKVARLNTTPDGTYTVATNAGEVTIVKSTMSNGNARLSWLFNGKKSSMSEVYNALKVVSPLIGEMDKADTSESDTEPPVEEVTFYKKDLKKEYSKKGLIKAMAKTGIVKKDFIKAVKKRIDGKKILGHDFVAIMDDEFGGEFPSIDINRVFDEINNK